MHSVHSRSIPGLATAVAVLGLLSCATNPVTGKSELALVSESQEIAMGRDYAVQVKQETGVYPDSGVQSYVSRLGLGLARTEIDATGRIVATTFDLLDRPTSRSVGGNLESQWGYDRTRLGALDFERGGKVWYRAGSDIPKSEYATLVDMSFLDAAQAKYK